MTTIRRAGLGHATADARRLEPRSSEVGPLLRVDPPAMRLAEVARRLAISRAAAYRLVRSGRLPGIQVGQSWRVLRADFDAYLAECRADAERRYQRAREQG